MHVVQVIKVSLKIVLFHTKHSLDFNEFTLKLIKFTQKESENCTFAKICGGGRAQKDKEVTTLQSMMNTKLSKQRF